MKPNDFESSDIVRLKEKNRIDIIVSEKGEVKTEYKHIGKKRNRIDAVPKVTGKAKYVGDIKMPGMLYGKVLWSPIAHANIKDINTRKAEILPGVHAVLTWKDVPRKPYNTSGHPYHQPSENPEDKYILDNKVRFVGDYVAAVAAESPEIAEEAIKLIEVEYEELKPILSIEEALDEANPEIHANTKNILDKNSYEFGDVEKGFREADYVFEDEFITPIIQHCPLETHVSMAYFEDNGRLVVHSATQAPFHLRRILSDATELPIGQIRVLKTYVGGGFGSKEDTTQEPLNAMLTLKTGRPVLLEFSREENMVSTTTRHSTKIHVKTGIMKDGKLIARQMKVLSNNGAYAGHGHAIVYNMSSQFPNLYPTPNIKFEGITVYTNMPVGSAMRAYGIPQLNFAMESHMDNIAGKLGIDPLELRRKNICKVGFESPLGYFVVNTCGIEECLEKGEELSGWKTKRSQKEEIKSFKKKGLGMACYSYASNTFPYGAEISGARIKLNEDGSATLFIGSVEIGQGNDTIMAQIAAEELGIKIEAIKVIAVDTDICPLDYGAYASRQTIMGGMAVKQAAIKCREALLDFAATMLKQEASELGVRDGWVINKETGEELITIYEVSMTAHYNQPNTIAISYEYYHKAVCNPLVFGAVFAEVEVDMITGKVHVEKIWSLHDSGVILNHQQAEGQVEGGVAMGMAFGLMEQLLVDPKTGKTLNDNLLDYKMPTTMDVPDLEVHFIETIEPTSAYGNKSLGEPPVVSVAPAIRNAVLNATGIAYGEIPLTPQRVYEKIAISEEER